MAVIHSLYREEGTVEFHRDLCKSCGQCASICPADVLVMEDDQPHLGKNSRFGCIACGHCMLVCPEGAITVQGRGISPDDLFTLPPKADRASAESLAALMESRRSVRRFRETEVDLVLLERILSMASAAPMGIPPWDIGCVIVQGRSKVKQLAAQIVEDYRTFLKIFRPWVLKLLRPFWKKTTFDQFQSFVVPLANTYVEHHDAGEDKLFYDAPAVLVFHHSAYCEPADAMIACTYAMLAAESLGLGTTIIGGAAPILQRNAKLSREVGIPAGNSAAITLIVGYPIYPFKRGVRRHFSHMSTVH